MRRVRTQDTVLRDRRLALGAALVAALALSGCAKDACEESLFPKAQLTLVVPGSLDVSKVTTLRLTLAGVVGGLHMPLPTQPAPISVTPEALRQPEPSVELTFGLAGGMAGGGSGSSLPPGGQLELAVALVEADATTIVAQGSVVVMPAMNACNFFTVTLAPPGATGSGPDGGGRDGASAGDGGRPD